MPPSLDVLEDVVRREYDAQERRADSLDTKAGLVLGFSGLLVSLTPPTLWPPLALLASLLAGAAALLSLSTIALNSQHNVRLDEICRQGVPDIRVDLVELLVFMHGDLRKVTHRKLWRIRAALLLLVLSMGTIGTGTAITVVRDIVR